MKVTAPISELHELEPLAKSGAEEFYCGVTPRQWIQSFSNGVWLNRRGPQSGNILSVDGLKTLVREAHRLGFPVYLTMNAQMHTASQLPQLKDLLRAAIEEAEVDSVIVGDIALMLVLRELYPSFRFMVSTVAVAGNREAAALYRDLGARRIIFPRHITFAEMEAIQRAVPELEYEAFVLNDACVFEEGYCHTQHGVRGLTAFCFTDWEERVHTTGSAGKTGVPAVLDDETAKEWREHLSDHREWLWYAQNCGNTLNAKELPNGHCGLCAIPDLARLGITSLKIVGREAGLWRKLRSVQLVRAVVDRVRAGASRDEARRFAVETRGDAETCSKGWMCYYREVKDVTNPSLTSPSLTNTVEHADRG